MRSAVQTIRGCIWSAGFERCWRRGTVDEQVSKNSDGVRQVQGAIVIEIVSVVAGPLGKDECKSVEECDSVDQRPLPITVDVTSQELGVEDQD